MFCKMFTVTIFHLFSHNIRSGERSLSWLNVENLSNDMRQDLFSFCIFNPPYDRQPHIHQPIPFKFQGLSDVEGWKSPAVTRFKDQ